MPVNLEVLLCYAREDELLCKELVIYLAGLKRQGFFDMWYDREISAGTEYEPEKDKHLNTAHIILLLVSQYFMNSDYCYLVEMQRAIERHNRGDARVIPVLLRPVYFQGAPFAKLAPLPTNKKPVTDASWHSIDEAFFDVAEGIRKSAEELVLKLSVNSPTTPLQTASRLMNVSTPRLASSRNHKYKAGDRVRHSKFGEGIVLKSEMELSTEFLVVQFRGENGKKRLSMDFAKLEKL